jgi:hypothetical protein
MILLSVDVTDSLYFGRRAQMAFQDLIIVYWTGSNGPAFDPEEKEFWAFANKLEESRYYTKNQFGSWQQLNLVGDVAGIKLAVEKWYGMPKLIQDHPYTVWIGFQGPKYGWELSGFHDILNVAEKIPALYPGFAVEWLADNWFDRKTLVPKFGGGDNALAWLESQLDYDIEEVEHG